MSTLGLLIGSEVSKAFHGVEDPSSTLRLGSVAASWAASNGYTVLALGDAPALLSVGTAVVGLQQGRVLEGGERRRSPMRVLSLLASENAERDRSLSFERRRRAETGGTQEPEDKLEQEQVFGDLSLLVDLGIMDIVGDSQLSLQPRPPEMVARNLTSQLFSEQPRGILAIGQLPEAVTEAVLKYHRETKSPFACILSYIEGADRLSGAEQIPMLNNRRLRFRGRRPFADEVEAVREDTYDTADEELMRAAQQATWEAELTFRIYQWLIDLTGDTSAAAG